MARRKPFFLTGANARIVLNNKSVAFATDISYSVEVRHASPRVLGKFEVETVQPLTYEVTGSLTILRYARGLKEFIGGKTPDNASQAGNGVGSFAADNGVIASALGLPSGGQFDGGAAENFDPSRFFQSKMFDIEIRQKLPIEGDTVETLRSFTPSTVFIPNGLNETNDSTIVVRLRDCRFTGSDFRLSKRGLPLQTMRFTARYADDDTSVARKSGVGQELS